MDGSDVIFIVLPIVAVVLLIVLVGLPYLGDREQGRSHAGGGPQTRGQIPGHPPDARGGDAIGRGHA
jgi:hypothetical protein